MNRQPLALHERDRRRVAHIVGALFSFATACYALLAETMSPERLAILRVRETFSRDVTQDRLVGSRPQCNRARNVLLFLNVQFISCRCRVTEISRTIGNLTFELHFVRGTILATKMSL